MVASARVFRERGPIWERGVCVRGAQDGYNCTRSRQIASREAARVWTPQVEPLEVKLMLFEVLFHIIYCKDCSGSI